MYARGILFGKMVLELGDTCTAKNENEKLHCDLDFKTKVRVLILGIVSTCITKHLDRDSFLVLTTPLLARFVAVQQKLAKFPAAGAMSWSTRI